MHLYLKTHKSQRNVICALLSYMASLALTYILNLGKEPTSDLFYMLSYGNNLLAIGVFIFGAFLLSRFIQLKDKRLKCFSLVAGLLLSVSTVYGAYALFVNNIFISVGTGILQTFLILGLNLLFTPLSAEIFILMEKFGTWYESKRIYQPCTMKNNALYFLIVWIIIFISYIPLFLAWWPGNFIYDARYQMSEVINNIYKTHHPLLHTWLMGTAYKIGVGWENVSKGFQLYTLLQMLVLSSSFAYCLLYFKKKGAPKLLRIISLLWFALFPMHSIFSITTTKDVLFAAFFLYTVIFFCRFFLDKEDFRWYTYVGLVTFSVLSALFRNNAIYAIVVFSIVGIILTRGWLQKGKVLLILIAIYLITSLCNQALIKGLEAREATPYRESFSVPLQGLGRVAAYRGKELDTILYDELCLYINERTIAGYNPFISDPIKNDAYEEMLENYTVNFLKFWIKVGMDFPDEYIESFVSNTMGYWYALPMNDYVTMNLSLYHTLIGQGQEIEKTNLCNWAYILYFDLFCNGDYRFVPVLGYSFRMAPYVWFIIFTVLWALMKKNKYALLVMILPVAYFFTCLLGPVAALRYVYCLIVCCPVYFYVIAQKQKDLNVEQ